MADQFVNPESHHASDALLARAAIEACQIPWLEAHEASWSEAYRAFGANPKKCAPSFMALRKQAEKAGVRPINAIVDAYNAVSLLFAIPVGGENLDHYVGMPRLFRARGDEPFDTSRDGEPVVEHPAAGEVVWGDEQGVTCRRWNWRQGLRTRIDINATRLWFVFEALEGMPDDAPEQAADLFVETAHAICPTARLERTRID